MARFCNSVLFKRVLKHWWLLGASKDQCFAFRLGMVKGFWLDWRVMARGSFKISLSDLNKMASGFGCPKT